MQGSVNMRGVRAASTALLELEPERDGNEKYPDPYSLVFGVEEACRLIQRRDFNGLIEL